MTGIEEVYTASYVTASPGQPLHCGLLQYEQKIESIIKPPNDNFLRILISMTEKLNGL
jgi:hypothetical protein